MKTKPMKKINLDEVVRLAGITDNDEDLAHNLGISVSTLYNRKRDNEEFAAAIKKGKAKAHSFVISKLMEAIEGGNVTAMIFYLKTRCGWRETERTELDIKQPFQFIIKNDLPPDHPVESGE